MGVLDDICPVELGKTVTGYEKLELKCRDCSAFDCPQAATYGARDDDPPGCIIYIPEEERVNFVNFQHRLELATIWEPEQRTSLLNEYEEWLEEKILGREKDVLTGRGTIGFAPYKKKTPHKYNWFEKVGGV